MFLDKCVVNHDSNNGKENAKGYSLEVVVLGTTSLELFLHFGNGFGNSDIICNSFLVHDLNSVMIIAPC
jgi:hypothetical protein